MWSCSDYEENFYWSGDDQMMPKQAVIWNKTLQPNEQMAVGEITNGGGLRKACCCCNKSFKSIDTNSTAIQMDSSKQLPCTRHLLHEHNQPASLGRTWPLPISASYNTSEQ